MPAYPEYVSAEAPGRRAPPVLIVGLNWLGDSLMAMPAIQAFAKAFPEKRRVLLVKPKLAELWALQPAIDETWTCPPTLNGLPQTVARIRQQRFATAFILPNSFRSALLPFLGGVPERVGLRGHYRHYLLTRTIPPPPAARQLHQKHENAAIFGVRLDENELPRLRWPADDSEKAQKILSANQRWAGLIPGAARGKAKRWPAEYFSALGRLLQARHHCGIVLFGSAADQELCGRINSDLGNKTVNLAGRTSLPELAALFARCAAVIGNDSGGVHLAAAAGAAVIVIYGLTAPAKTRPLGRKVVVLQNSSTAARDIPRDSPAAEKCLRKISPEHAADACQALLAT